MERFPLPGFDTDLPTSDLACSYIADSMQLVASPIYSHEAELSGE